MKYEEIMETLYKIIDAIRYTKEVVKLPSCNDCALKECEHRQKWG